MNEQIEFLAPTSFFDIFVPLIIPILIVILINFYGKRSANSKAVDNGDKRRQNVNRIITRLAIALLVFNVLYEVIAYIYLGIQRESGKYTTLTDEISYFVDTNSGRDFVLQDVYFIVGDDHAFCFRRVEDVDRNRKIELDYIRLGFNPLSRKCVLSIRYLD